MAGILIPADLTARLQEIVAEMLNSYAVPFTDNLSRQVAIDSWAQQFEEAATLAVQQERERLIGILKERGDLKGDEPIAHTKPGHGPCCTCQTCGYNYDDCVCSHNELLAAIRRGEG